MTVRAFESYLRTLMVEGLAPEVPVPAFESMCLYPVEAGGKRLRPLLCLATVGALGGDVERAFPAAAAVELVHTFSLVHDDLPALDDDDTRRGLPTTHIVHGEAQAVLVGDALLSAAYRVLAERLDVEAELRIAAIMALARGVDGMIRGQHLDLTMDAAPSEDQLRDMCRLKTGCLIEAAIEIGLEISAAPEVVASGYRALAREIGLGFQIVDDVLDATGSTEVLGKPAGSDAAHDKRTFVTVLGLERATMLAAESRGRAASLVSGLDGETDELARLVWRVYDRDA